MEEVKREHPSVSFQEKPRNYYVHDGGVDSELKPPPNLYPEEYERSLSDKSIYIPTLDPVCPLTGYDEESASFVIGDAKFRDRSRAFESMRLKHFDCAPTREWSEKENPCSVYGVPDKGGSRRYYDNHFPLRTNRSPSFQKQEGCSDPVLFPSAEGVFTRVSDV